MTILTIVLVSALAGCLGGTGGPEAADTSPVPATTSEAPSYSGDLPPGLQATPLWAISPLNSGAEVKPVGGSLAVMRRTDRGTVVEFRDAVTGKVLRNVDLGGEARTTTWHGRPAVMSTDVETVPSDGISPPRSRWVLEVVDDKGVNIVRRETPDTKALLIFDGRRIEVEDGAGSAPGALVISDAGADTPGWRIPCRSRTCVNDTATVAAGIVVHRTGGTTGPESLTGYDAATGAKRWAPAALARPKGVPAVATPGLVVHNGGKLLTGWYTGSDADGTAQFNTVTFAVNDPADGRLLSTGPTLSGSFKSAVTNADDTITVVATTNTTAAWETATGKLLWQQEKDETRIRPTAIVGTVLYSGDKPSMAVDLRTKTVLDRTVPDPPLPVGTGYALVEDKAKGKAYVFALKQG